MSPPLLETDRALLRPLLPADAPALGIAMRDANVTETISFDPPARTEAEGTAQALVRIAGFSSHWERYGFGIFGAFERQTEQLVGYCGFRHIDEFDNDIHLSTMVDRPYWSGGLASEIIRRNLEYVFLERNFDTVFTATRSSDGPSVKITKRFGFIREDDRKLQDWSVCYYNLPREVFLTQHVGYLKQQLTALTAQSAQAPQTMPSAPLLIQARDGQSARM